MSKKKIWLIIIVIIIAVVIGVGAIFGVRAYNAHITQKQIEERTKAIEDVYAEFEAKTDRQEKLKILSDFITAKPSTADETSLTVLEAVEPLYIETLTKMRQYFIDDYKAVIDKNTFPEADISEDREKLLTVIDTLSALGETAEGEKNIVFFSDSTGAKGITDQINLLIKKYRQLFIDDYKETLKENTFDDTEKIKDKDKLNKAIQNLSALRETIESEKETIFETDGDTYSEIINTIDDLISKYQTRIEDIERAEEEAKKAEENNDSSNYSDSNNYDYNYEVSNSGSGGNYDSGKSGSVGNSSGSSSSSNITWYESDDGHISYRDRDTGESWDNEGHHWNIHDIEGNW